MVRPGLSFIYHRGCPSCQKNLYAERLGAKRELLKSHRERLRKLQDKIARLKAARAAGKEWPEDPVEFCSKFLGFQPTAYQEKLLRDRSQFIVARWARQAGKTHCVAALLLWHCLKTQGFNVLVLAPSIRQSKITIRKITGFLSRLPKYVALRPYKTKVEFYNGSRIQAFPNSPETIRGEPSVNLVYEDEASYIRNDKELHQAVVFTLVTTNGRFLATSTPGSRDSLFYAMCTDDENYGDVSRHHVSYQDALEPKGPLKLEILEKLKRQLASDPWRWRREMEAEFAEDEDAWLGMELIRKCVEENLEYVPDSALFTS